jgi:general secretion pathway protein G
MRWKRTLIPLSAVLLVLLAATLLVSCRSVTSIQKAREGVLQQDLFTLRTLLNQYFVDLHKRPHSLDELMTAGYLKQIPTDPMTGRNDSWTLEWSNDPKIPGITNIRSSSQTISSTGTACRDW